KKCKKILCIILPDIKVSLINIWNNKCVCQKKTGKFLKKRLAYYTEKMYDYAIEGNFYASCCRQDKALLCKTTGV
ncbi:hypothetical protein C3R19_15395, partial [Blautia producta]